MVPLWSSILVRIFAWRTILGGNGLLNEFLQSTSGILDHPSSAFLYNEKAIAITWAYVWLPFMVLPIFTALEKIPDSYLEASRDLGRGLVDDVPQRRSSRSLCPAWSPARSSSSR